MGMMIDKAIKVLIAIRGGLKYALTIPIYSNEDKEDREIDKIQLEAIIMAIDTMRKYQKIEQILKDIPYGGEVTVRRIQEVIEDGDDKV